MDYKNFPANWFLDIEDYLQKNRNQKHYAAFDADGTLWDTDLGENFFKWQISNCPELGLPPDPWQHYLDLKAQDPKVAYLWLAQINAERSIQQVEDWSISALKSISPLPIFTEQKKLISLLHKYEVNVFIVTASVSWAVLPGAAVFSVPAKNVLGVRTQLVDGKVSLQQDGHITYRQGKVTELLQNTNGQKPFLCSGNSNGDIELLGAATHFRIAVRAAAASKKLFKAEQELADLAQQNSWWQHSFIEL